MSGHSSESAAPICNCGRDRGVHDDECGYYLRLVENSETTAVAWVDPCDRANIHLSVTTTPPAGGDV